MKRILSIVLIALAAVTADAQSNLKKVYDETADPMKQISKAVQDAGKDGRFVICQVGGNWCRWCLMFAEFITTDEEIKTLIDKNFEYIHVNYDPRKPKDETALKMLERLGNPERFGFPVLVVLDSKGKVIHTQDSSFLEEGNGYDKAKVIRFFTNWTPSSCSHRPS
jgi:thioredoxin-related protein